MERTYQIVVALEDLVAWAPISNVFSASYNAWKWAADKQLPARFIREELDLLADYARRSQSSTIAELAILVRDAVTEDNWEDVRGLLNEADDEAQALDEDARKHYKDKATEAREKRRAYRDDPGNETKKREFLQALEDSLPPFIKRIAEKARHFSPELADKLPDLVGLETDRDGLREALHAMRKKFDRALTDTRRAKVGYPYWRGMLIQFVTPKMLPTEEMSRRWKDWNPEGVAEAVTGLEDGLTLEDEFKRKLYERLRYARLGDEHPRAGRDFFNENEAIVFYRGDQPVFSFAAVDVQRGIWINIYPAGQKLGAKGLKGRLARVIPVAPDDFHDKWFTIGTEKPNPLNKHGVPFRGGITFWTDVGSGYDVAMRQDAHKMDRKSAMGRVAQHGTHSRFQFTLPDGPYDTDVYWYDDQERGWRRTKGVGNLLDEEHRFRPVDDRLPAHHVDQDVLQVWDVFDEIDRIVINSTTDESFGHWHGQQIHPPMDGIG